MNNIYFILELFFIILLFFIANCSLKKKEYFNEENNLPIKWIIL